MPRIFGRKNILYMSTIGPAPFDPEPDPDEPVVATVRPDYYPDLSTAGGELYCVVGRRDAGFFPFTSLPAESAPPQPDRWDRSQHCGYCGRSHFVRVGEALRDDCPGCGGAYVEGGR